MQVGDELLVKVIDIDLERRRISLSLKQANEPSSLVNEVFDPTQYGMEAQYDEQGNYIYPEGFDPETQQWLPGFEEQQAEWERQYAAAQARYEAHMAQVRAAQEAEAEAAGPSSYSSEATQGGSAVDEETLQKLREQFGGS